MGDVAEDYISGECCSDCGCYFLGKRDPKTGIYSTRQHGYPVVCRDCWAEASQSKRKQYKQSGLKRAIFKT